MVKIKQLEISKMLFNKSYSKSHSIGQLKQQQYQRPSFQSAEILTQEFY